MASLQGAVNALADTPDVWVTGVSPVYETEPVDCPGRLETSSTPSCSLDTTLAADPAARPGAGHRGRLRPRAQRGRGNAPRTLDVDLIVVGDRRSDDDALRLPHPRAPSAPSCCALARRRAGRRFPDKGPVADLLGDRQSGVTRRDDLELEIQ